jgi:hypothetical protein
LITVGFLAGSVPSSSSSLSSSSLSSSSSSSERSICIEEPLLEVAERDAESRRFAGGCRSVGSILSSGTGANLRPVRCLVGDPRGLVVKMGFLVGHGVSGHSRRVNPVYGSSGESSGERMRGEVGCSGLACTVLLASELAAACRATTPSTVSHR